MKVSKRNRHSLNRDFKWRAKKSYMKERGERERAELEAAAEKLRAERAAELIAERQSREKMMHEENARVEYSELFQAMAKNADRYDGCGWG